MADQYMTAVVAIFGTGKVTLRWVQYMTLKCISLIWLTTSSRKKMLSLIQLKEVSDCYYNI